MTKSMLLLPLPPPREAPLVTAAVCNRPSMFVGSAMNHSEGFASESIFRQSCIAPSWARDSAQPAPCKQVREPVLRRGPSRAKRNDVWRRPHSTPPSQRPARGSRWSQRDPGIQWISDRIVRRRRRPAGWRRLAWWCFSGAQPR